MLFGEGSSPIFRSIHSYSFLVAKLLVIAEAYLFKAFENTMIRQLDSRSLIQINMILFKLIPRNNRSFNQIIPGISNDILPVSTASHVPVFDSPREPFLNKGIYIDRVRTCCESPERVWVCLGLFGFELVDVERSKCCVGSIW